MARIYILLITLILTLVGLASTQTSAFPDGFLWGSATASYQVEGAWNVSRGATIWDIFSHTPGKTANGDTGDTADDNYYRFMEDIQLMKNMGLTSYRFSIAWSRLFPTGVAPANPEGFAHYDALINALIAADITPFVTLFHWDLPAALEDSWLSPNVTIAFAKYATAVFEAYGDRVKNWITFNEPLSFCEQGYGTGTAAPGRCSNRTICAEGNSSTEPYIAAHHVLIAHGLAVDIYRQNFQKQQQGIIGITLNCDWSEPMTSSVEDFEASERHMIFQLAWWADPIFKGDYPEVMKTLLGDRLPVFTEEQKQMINGSWDYFGLNHYTSAYGANQPNPVVPPYGWDDDQQVIVSHERNGEMIGSMADSTWLYVVPWGIRKMLNWVADRYDNPPLYITENGCDVPNESQIPFPQVLNDTFRIDFYSQYISNVSAALNEDNVDVRGYFAWSLMDNFEWADGYTKRFGLHYVDYTNNLTRTPKSSAHWFADFIASN